MYFYQKYSGKWEKIAELIPGRNASQCAQRYRRLNPQRVRAHWTEEEDQVVRKMVRKYGKNWGLIASNLEGRNGKQVRERYINCLDPQINWNTFTKREDKIIWDYFKRHGARWSELAKMLTGRPENMIKNRYYAHLKRLNDTGQTDYLQELEAMPEEQTGVEELIQARQLELQEEAAKKQELSIQKLEEQRKRMQQKRLGTTTSKNHRLGKPYPATQMPEDDEEEEADSQAEMGTLLKKRIQTSNFRGIKPELFQNNPDLFIPGSKSEGQFGGAAETPGSLKSAKKQSSRKQGERKTAPKKNLSSRLS